MKARVLVAEKNEPVRAAIVNALVDAGYGVVKATDSLSALRILEWVPIDAMLLDLGAPMTNLLFVLRHLTPPCAPVVIAYSSSPDDQIEELHAHVGQTVFRHLQRPASADDLVAAVEDALAGQLVEAGAR